MFIELIVIIFLLHWLIGSINNDLKERTDKNTKDIKSILAVLEREGLSQNE
jgi:hypothetical protein